MYSIKVGVTIVITPEIEKMLAIVSKVYTAFYIPVVVTSGVDGPHREGSLHYKLRAFDLRKNFRDEEDKVLWEKYHTTVMDTLEMTFRDNKFPVHVVEEQDHIHIEWYKE